MEATGNFLKILIKYMYEKPSCLFCIIALYGAFVMYQDNQKFIGEQQNLIREQQTVLKEISTTQSEIQRALVELNIRVQNLEQKNHG